MQPDTIRIHRLRAVTHVGVPDAERANAQEVEICLRLVPKIPLVGLDDQLGKTIDYYVVSQSVLKLAVTGERKLIETLADDLARMLLDEFPLAEVGVEVRKFILPETDYVSVELNRDASP